MSLLFDENHADFTNDGIYYLHVQYQVVDGDGAQVLQSEVRTSKPTRVDIAPPRLNGLSNDSVIARSKTWTWTCSEPACTYRFTVNANASHTFPADTEWTSAQSATQTSGDGTYYLHIQARDAAEKESALESYSITLDNTAPTLTGLADDRTPVVAKQWTWSCMDTTACTYRFTVNANATHTFTNEAFTTDTSTTYSASGGSLYIHVQARDLAGNLSQVVSALAIIDNSRPRVTGLAQDTTPTKSKTWTWTCSKSPCTYRHTINQNHTHTFTTTDTYNNTTTATPKHRHRNLTTSMFKPATSGEMKVLLEVSRPDWTTPDLVSQA